jgi:hypothetical protein
MKVSKRTVKFRSDYDLARIALLNVLLFSLWMSTPAMGQEVCDTSLSAPQGSPHGYRLRGDRCEGIYVQELAGTTLKVAALIESFEDYSLTGAQDLRVAWTPLGEGTVSLRAWGLKPRLYYRMDTTQSAARASYSWPTGILASLNIRRQDAGVLGWVQWDIGGIKQRVYLPLRISQQRDPVRSDSYQVVLLPGRQLSEVYIRLAPVYADGRLGKLLRDGEPLQYGHYPAERGIVIPISGAKVPGIYYLEIGADLAGGGVATTQLYFFHADR